WAAAAWDLAGSLGIDPTASAPTEGQDRRIFHLYLPLFFWIQGMLEGRKSAVVSTKDSFSRTSLVIGVSAPQGCGKTTLVEQLRRLLESRGASCAVLSIDDFYLTGEQQDAIAAKYPHNPLLQVRGNAGTHDLDLGLATLRGLRSLQANKGVQPAASVRIPRYDKSARGGRGDRAPMGVWPEMTEPPDVILLEGWMLGFQALPEGSPVLKPNVRGEIGVNAGLGEVNKFLQGYSELHEEVDAWVVLKTSDPNLVFEWRAEAERQMRAEGRGGMSEEEVSDFCSRYMPAYRAYLPGLYLRGQEGWAQKQRGGSINSSSGAGVSNPGAGMGGRTDKGRIPTVMIEVGRDRNPV
ncbi:unnamed protein product, partial [Discosporangium mesarthrocarpum]